MPYVDGYVMAVPTRKLKAYIRLAKWGERVWRKHGALDYKECIGDDLATQCGTPYGRLLKLKPGETAVFAYIVYRSRAHRDRVNAKVFAEMMRAPMPKDMPFDMKRMTHGGFKVAVGAGSAGARSRKSPR